MIRDLGGGRYAHGDTAFYVRKGGCGRTLYAIDANTTETITAVPFNSNEGLEAALEILDAAMTTIKLNKMTSALRQKEAVYG